MQVFWISQVVKCGKGKDNLIMPFQLTKVFIEMLYFWMVGETCNPTFP